MQPVFCFSLCRGESKSSLSLSSHRLSLSYQINMISLFHPCVLAWTLATFIHPFIFAINTEHRESHFIFRLPQYCLVANTSSVLKSVLSVHLLWGSFYPCWAHWNKSTTPATLATTTSMLQLKPEMMQNPSFCPNSYQNILHMRLSKGERQHVDTSNGSQQGYFTLW